jgi:hypothetical protein
MPEQNALAKELCEPLEGWRESHGPWKVDPGDDLSEFEAAVLWSSTSRNCSRPTMSATWTKAIKLIARNKTLFKAIQNADAAAGAVGTRGAVSGVTYSGVGSRESP